MAVIKIQEAKKDIGPEIGASAGVTVKVWATPGPLSRFSKLARSFRRRYVIRTIGRKWFR